LIVANSFVAQTSLNFTGADRSRVNVPEFDPLYTTEFGSAYCADALEVLKVLPEGSTNLVLTSPPYALHFKKEYGNVEKKEYIDWFMGFAEQIFRILPDDGSFVLNIGGSYNAGQPTRSLYHFKLLIALVEELGFHLAQECFWYNPAKMPMPAEWVNVRRIRVKDSVEYIWWLSKTPNPKASNLKVLNPYSQDMIRLNQRGLKKTVRPSGHNIKPSFSQIDAGGSIPSNVIEENMSAENMLIFGNNAANDSYAEGCKQAGIKRHPARFPAALPEFFIKLLTDEGDLVLDPFAGSNTTGSVAEKLQRFWMAVDNTESYLEGSKYRFFQSS
jgi:site-specific DNA-methyltransferase (cytosine-N4-specific)